jgi:hypothetical protein
MAEKDQIEDAIIDSLQVDDEGYKEVKVIDINKLTSLGVADVPAFLQGVLDAENESDVNESDKDYIKGYRYGKTGTF